MELNQQHLFRLAILGLTAYLAWSTLSGSGSWTKEEISKQSLPAVRETALPDYLDLGSVRDLFPWSEEERHGSRGTKSSHGEGGQPVGRREVRPDLEVEGVFTLSDARFVLVDGAWLGVGDLYQGSTIVEIQVDRITLRRDDQQYSVNLPDPEIRLY